MPTVLLIKGWRLYFWANENNEPIHIHAEKGDMECKFWLDEENFDIKPALEYNLTPQARREIKKLFMSTLSILFLNGTVSLNKDCYGKSL